MLPRVLSLLISALLGAITGILIAGAFPAFAATTTQIDLPVAKSYAQVCGGAGGSFAPVTSARVPGLCLPSPCAAQLSRAQFGALILGRAADGAAWDSYASRYAETCRAEAVAPGLVPRAATTAEFWEPLIDLGTARLWPVLTPLVAGGDRSVTAFYAGPLGKGTWDGPQAASPQRLLQGAAPASGARTATASAVATGFTLAGAEEPFVFAGARALRSTAAAAAMPLKVQLVLSGQAEAVGPCLPRSGFC
ncbi:hypothetical protein [Loktanella sp. R86503]|uniref:hypothetical protein n=1 Tax=Loktanella sp. R86503 TaxID=3093847 RepID=UPI0036DCCC33